MTLGTATAAEEESTMTPDPMTDQQRKQDGHEDPGRPKALRRPDGGRGEQHEQREEREHEQEQEQEQRQEQPFLMLSPTMHAPAANGPGPRGHTHVRSRSLAAPSSAPVMARAHSSPGLDSRGSPPSQSAASYTAYSSGGSRAGGGRSVSPSWSPALHNTLPRVSRRRPSSPLLTHAPGQTSNGYTSNGHMSNGGILGSSATTASTPSSASSPSRPSPLILPAKFNEPYPAYSLSLASSMPSTPTSIRSRSPSISSLETIPDIPDAEAAAIEADQIARLKAAADKADAAAEAGGFPHDLKRRSAVDISSSSPGSRFGSGWADKRKRWSVCGAEGRQDLDLETIWED
ncbi:hypothetical protein A7C99_0115 [Trichophyton rubrum]|uniref:Basic proline-rich protein n=1 Tax=Trichophyton rubrum TaxID=5551 RepID=A0A178F9B1_TRIRU|nr:hypothetical protein A7C99_0115 [Trichophyton rubrum]